MAIKEIIHSVECGYMSPEQARQIMIGNSGSSFIGSGDWLIAADIVKHGEVHNWGYYQDKYGEPGKIRCPYCGRKNDTGDEVCESCGAVL